MFTKRICCITILALLFPAISLAGQPCRCAQQNVVGTYAVMAEGKTIMTLEDGTQMPIPVASLMVVTIDPEGNASSSGYVALGDQIMPFGTEPGYPPMNSTITINSDCTGTEELSSGQVAELIVQKNGNEINSIMIQGGPLGAPIITARWKRITWAPFIGNYHCPPNSVRGTYVAHHSGVNIIPEFGLVPGAFVGRASIDYNDTVEFSGMAMVGGTQMPFTFANGIWEDGELECTGTIIGDIMAGGVQYMGSIENWFVVLDSGNELWSITLADPHGNPVALMTAKRTSWWPTSLE